LVLPLSLIKPNDTRMTFFRIFCSIVLFILHLNLNGQKNKIYTEFTDDRDGKKYQTIKIDETLWIAENMKFKTANSEEHYIIGSEQMSDGYYYPLEEIDEVCPNGFQVPTTKEWENYIRYISAKNDGSNNELEILRMKKEGKAFVTSNISYPMDSMNLLKIQYHGHTQNKQIMALGSFNMWITHSDTKDSKYHLHMDEDGFSIHTHKHHLIDEKKKRRKFSMRCVKTD